MAEQKLNIEFSAGQLVELHGLSKAELNGQTGTIESFDKSSERYIVKLNDARMRIRRVNLRVLTAYRAVRIEGKGMGLVATCSLQPGQVIFEEDIAVGFKKGEPFTLQSIVDKYNALGEEQRARFMALSYHAEEKEQAHPQLKIHQIYFNNRIENERCALQEHFAEGLLLTFSLLNHCCIPNTFSFFEDSGKVVVIALKEIAVNEEILIQYLGGFYALAERQRKLQKTWKFACRCAVCSRDKLFQSHLDALYAQYNQLQSKVNSVDADVSVDQRIKCCLEMIAMLHGQNMKQEPRIILSKLSLFLAQFYIQLKDWDNAVDALSDSIRNDLTYYGQRMDWTQTNIVIKSISNKFLKQHASTQFKEFVNIKGIKVPFLNEKKKSVKSRQKKKT